MDRRATTEPFFNGLTSPGNVCCVQKERRGQANFKWLHTKNDESTEKFSEFVFRDDTYKGRFEIGWTTDWWEKNGNESAIFSESHWNKKTRNGFRWNIGNSKTFQSKINLKPWKDDIGTNPISIESKWPTLYLLIPWQISRYSNITAHLSGDDRSSYRIGITLQSHHFNFNFSRTFKRDTSVETRKKRNWVFGVSMAIKRKKLSSGPNVYSSLSGNDRRCWLCCVGKMQSSK